MKAVNSVKLNEWILDNRQSLVGPDRGTIKDCAERAAHELGFKVSTNALVELMQANGIETRRQSQRQSERLALMAEIEELTAENQKLKQTLAKVAASEVLTEDLKDYIFADLSIEVREAIFS